VPATTTDCPAVPAAGVSTEIVGVLAGGADEVPDVAGTVEVVPDADPEGDVVGREVELGLPFERHDTEGSTKTREPRLRPGSYL